MNCPWSQYTPVQSVVSLCEEPLCGWVVQPANTWSNIGYLIVGILLLRGNKAIEKTLFGATAIALFFGSTAFHMTLTYVGQVLDLSAIYLISAAIIALNLKRLCPPSSTDLNKIGVDKRRAIAIYCGVVLISVITMVLLPRLGVLLFALQIIAGLGLEWQIHRKKIPSYRPPLWLALGLFLLAAALWVADITKVLCDPHNHIFGAHAAWHFLCATAIFFMCEFYLKQPKPDHLGAHSERV